MERTLLLTSALVVSAVAHAGVALAAPPLGFVGTTVSRGLFEEINLKNNGGSIFDACGSHANGTELELFSAAPVPFTPGQLAADSGCPGRHCGPDATIGGCCNIRRRSGIDSRGPCSVNVGIHACRGE
jgi:hypothetical protein